MRIKRIFLGLLLAISLPAWPADEQPQMAEPDHLEPVDPYPRGWGVRFSEIRTRFNLGPSFYLQMFVCPSFDPEYVVRMHGNEKDLNVSEEGFNAAEKVFLTYSIADKSVYDDKRKQQKVTVSTKTVDFPKPLAARVHKLWHRMLRRTRYSDTYYGGVDGTNYEFAMWGWYGTIWSPKQRQSPLLLIELGDSLIDYCKAVPSERPAAAKAIEDKAAQLEKYLDEHTSK
jgi:hypothetical protein